MLALTVTLSIAAPARAAELRLERLATSSQPPVASGKSGGLAYLLSPTSLRVRRTGQPARAYAVPAGCVPSAMGADVVALAHCPAEPGRFRTEVLDESDGSIVTVREPANQVFDSAAVVGSHWLLMYGGEGRASRRYLVGWRTGQVIELESFLGPVGGEPFGVREYINYDTPDPFRRLCAPVRRVLGQPIIVERIGRWVMQSEFGGRAWLQRCSSRQVIGSPHWRDEAFGRDALGYRIGRRLVLRDLRANRRLSGPWPNPDRSPRLAMYGRRLVAFDTDGPLVGSYRIYLGPRLR